MTTGVSYVVVMGPFWPVAPGRGGGRCSGVRGGGVRLDVLEEGGELGAVGLEYDGGGVALAEGEGGVGSGEFDATCAVAGT
ncbi:hypothetical protein GCM10023080_086200 [Streptomyces pseudoechinosporeus]